MAANTHTLAQVLVTGEDRRLPANTLFTQHFTQLLIQVNQTRRVTQALTIGRVADDKTQLPAIRAGGKGGQLPLVYLDPLGHASALDVITHRLQQTRISLIATNPYRRLGQTLFSAIFCLVHQPLPHGRHVLQPATEAPALALQVRGDVSRH